ncbi:methyltransferase [Actinoplanes sp. NBRC 103695]|uniref:methyltransferase n=1 Tax=Actinoplanes sp. NBRC 103695 TaxID=3032202 RepID=UPI0024A4620A|nr:methyltransferase [Actinoplanes sp. NBRC 103695]GLY96229.1 hypothetical protein Acsp02_34840 [Actinoplanes sp. NBRC 103695]
MPQPLETVLAEVRDLLLDPALTRAVAAGRRRGQEPSVRRAELRPVSLKDGTKLQIVTDDGARPFTRNVSPGEEAAAAVDELLAEPFGNWHVETAAATVQVRITKKGDAQVHRAAANRAEAAPREHDRSKQWLLDPGDPLFQVLGANAAKRRQVDAFLRALAATLPAELPSPLRVVDLGCGNAYLTFAAYRYLADRGGQVQVVGVDVREDQRVRNTALAASLGCADDVTFVAGTIEDATIDAAAFKASALDASAIKASAPDASGLDASGLDASAPDASAPDASAPDASAPDASGLEDAAIEVGASEDASVGVRPDLVLALHACDTATDQALARAVRWDAKWVLAAPCCHHDIAAQLKSNPAPDPYAELTRHPILRERFADVLTDTLRAALLRTEGYKVDVVEFVDSAHTPRNLLLRARHTGVPAPRTEYEALTAQWGVTPALEKLLA